jgi:hypothetical protein
MILADFALLPFYTIKLRSEKLEKVLLLSYASAMD